MGNCQAAEAATVIIQHPRNKVERLYWSVSARQVMSSNPGHYVALVLGSPMIKSENGMRARQVKLLRPDDTLLIGQVYRLISVEDVMKEFAAKKSVKLGKLLKDRGLLAGPTSNPNAEMENRVHRGGSSSRSSRDRGAGRHQQQGGGGGPWRPALQSISEIGS